MSQKIKVFLPIGIIFAIITLIVDAFQTIVTNLRPIELDSLLFSWTTACVEFVFIIPFFILSIKRRIPKKFHSTSPSEQVLSKKDMPFLRKSDSILRLSLAIVIYAFCAYFLILGFSSVDNITGILAVKTQPISMLLIGALFLKEKLTWKEIVTGFMMLFLVYFILTQGTFALSNITFGVIFLLIVPVFWNIAHSLVKPFLVRNQLSVYELIFIRIGGTAFILGIFVTIYYSILGNTSDLLIIFRSDALISIICMGLMFGLSHICWFKTVKELPLSIASMIVIPSPVITAFITSLFLSQSLYYYHYIGIVGEIIGLYLLIFIQKKKHISK